MNARNIVLICAAVFVFISGYAQNTCQTATVISPGNGTLYYTASTTGVANDNATSGAGICITPVGTAGQKWYKFTWTACGSTQVTVSTDYPETNFDTKLHVYTGSCGSLICVTGNDDGGVIYNLTSQLTFTAEPGNTYYIRVGGYNTASGNFKVSFYGGYGGCTNEFACNYDLDADYDNCSCVEETMVSLYHVDFTNASQGKWMYLMDGESLGDGVAGGEGVFRCLDDPCHLTIAFYNGTSEGWAGHAWSITMGGQVFSGNAPNSDEDWTYMEVNVPFCGCMDPVAPNYDGQALLDDGSCHYPDANSTCATAQLILLNTVLDITNEYQPVQVSEISCGGSPDIRDLWYSFTYSTAKLIIRATPGTLADTRIAVYESCNAQPIFCNDDAGIGLGSELILNCEDGLVAGQTYFLQVGGFNTNAGTFGLELTWNYEYGCMDPNAVNYDPCANVWDGTCYYCAADLNLDGVVGVSDLLLFTSQYGSDCSPN